MKLTLPQRSIDRESHIKEITDAILDCAKDKIAFIILFGSFARGDWVFERYSEDGIVYHYASDYDFLIITKSKKKDDENGISSFDLERKIKHEIRQRSVVRHIHENQFVIEPIDYVNAELKRGRYFFSDIKKEGILLYDSGELKLAEAKILSEKEKQAIARQDYKHWFGKAEEFLDHHLFGISKEYYSTAAFALHQATESLYNCALLVITGYKPKSHDLEDLNSLCASQLNDFLNIFPLATDEQKECFKLLQKAYVDSRYNKNYKITKEQLEYLLSCVWKLKNLVEKVCKERI
jgi:HEPN domain-containing protein/predicted nucleotidyltransferase